MKTLIMQTILVILAVTATTAWAWAQETEKASATSSAAPEAGTGAVIDKSICDKPDWVTDKVCNPDDKNLTGSTASGSPYPKGVTAAEVPECKYADGRCYKNMVQGRMKDSTSANGASGGSQKPATGSKNREAGP